VRKVLLALAALVTALTLTSCAETGVSATDAYKIGCPAVDSALGGGTAINNVTVTGLKALRDSNQLGPEAQSWLVAVIGALESSKPEDMPADAKKLIIDGCEKNGYQLQNL
jgi:outer membrane lipoprotein SlyB